MYLITDEKADKFTALIDHFRNLFLGTAFVLSPESDDVSVRITGKVKASGDITLAGDVLKSDGYQHTEDGQYDIYQKIDNSFGSVVVSVNKSTNVVSLTFNV